MSDIKFFLDGIDYKIDSKGLIWRRSVSTGYEWMQSCHKSIEKLQQYTGSRQAQQILAMYNKLHTSHPVDVF